MISSGIWTLNCLPQQTSRKLVPTQIFEMSRYPVRLTYLIWVRKNRITLLILKYLYCGIFSDRINFYWINWLSSRFYFSLSRFLFHFIDPNKRSRYRKTGCYEAGNKINDL